MYKLQPLKGGGACWGPTHNTHAEGTHTHAHTCWHPVSRRPPRHAHPRTHLLAPCIFSGDHQDTHTHTHTLAGPLYLLRRPPRHAHPHAHTHKSHRTVAERVSPNPKGKLAQDSYPALHITQPKTIHISIHSLYKVIYIDNQHGWQSMLMQPRHLYRFATHSCRTEIGPRLYT
jgi:hypothetical protein